MFRLDQLCFCNTPKWISASVNYKAPLAYYPTEAWQQVIRNAIEHKIKNSLLSVTQQSQQRWWVRGGGMGGTLTTPPGQTGDRAVQAGTKSINNRDPSRQDWQPRGPADQLRQERRKKRDRDLRGPTPITTTGSSARASKTTNTWANTHALYHTHQQKYMGH